MGGIVSSVADVVGDVVGGVADVAGDVVETVVDNPELALIGGAIALPYLAPELLAGGVGAEAGGAGLLGADIAGAGSLGYVPGAEAAAAYTSGTGLSGSLFGTIPSLSPAAIAEGAVPVATQGLLGAGGAFNPLAGSIANIIPSTPTDFITSFIPKTPTEIAKTLGTTALLGAATQAQPQLPGVNMTMPSSNIPQYGARRNILDSFSQAKQNISDILYPQGLITTQPSSAGIYSQFLQQRGLI